jgi:hypothetical protein
MVKSGISRTKQLGNGIPWFEQRGIHEQASSHSTLHFHCVAHQMQELLSARNSNRHRFEFRFLSTPHELDIMTIRTRAAGIAAAFAITFTGCGKSPEGGQPGTTETFTVSAPLLPVMIKQGDKQTVTIKVDRDASFKDDIAVKHEEPKGLKVEFSKAVLGAQTIKPGEPGEILMSISADKDVTPGEHVVKVIATPSKGTATQKDVKVKVEAINK